MQNSSFYIWIVPFSIPVLGFFLSKIPYLKKTRLTINVLLLFTAFMMDLQNISLRSVSASLIFGFIIMMIVMKISWSALGMKVKLFRYVIILAGFAIFFAKYGEWLVSTSDAVNSWYFPISVETHSKARSDFEIREFEMVRRDRSIHRVFKFGSIQKTSIFIKWLDSFPVPDSYVNTPFKYRWYLDQKAGMTAALIGGTDTLWTLKEVR